MQKKHIYILAGILVAAVAAFFIFSGNGGKKGGKKNDMSTNDQNLYPLGDPGSVFTEATSAIQSSGGALNYNDLMTGLKSGKINFVWELWAMRRNCPENYTGDQCDSAILEYIEKNYNSPEKENLKQLFSKYFKFEKEMKQNEMPKDLSFEERYDLIKKKRKEILGEEDASLVFGMEESQVGFVEATKNFNSLNKKLSGDDRVKKFEDLKKKTYGQYYDAITSREEKFENYQVELNLRESELGGLKGDDKDKKLRSIQEKYFGKEGADRIAKMNEENLAMEKKIADYEKQEKEFLSQNSSLGDKEKKEKLDALRVKALGQEEADSYASRKEFERLSKEYKQ